MTHIHWLLYMLIHGFSISPSCFSLVRALQTEKDNEITGEEHDKTLIET